jgi:glycine hydroxymethyltransferase
VAFGLALGDDFARYQKQVVLNAGCFAKALENKHYRIVSGGTDTHLFLVDLQPKGITGKEAVGILTNVNITLNKNLIPFDPKPPVITSGVRIGSPAITTRGMKEKEMELIAGFIDRAITDRADSVKLEAVKNDVLGLTEKFPLYPELKM